MSLLSTTLHPCLRINEIVSSIAQNLEQPANRAALTAMALTCKAFYDPAMNARWHTVNDIGRFLPLFPDGIIAFHEPEVGGSSGSWSVVRVPSDEEWDRFEHYARRVKMLTWDKPWTERATSTDDFSLLSIMKIRYGDSPAFPSLRHLGFTATSISKPDLWSLFIQARLVSLWSIHLDWGSRSDIDSSSLIRQTGVGAPSLSYLFLSMPDRLELEAIRILAQMPSLKTLAIQLRTTASDLARLEELSPDGFPSLKSLYVTISPDDSADDCAAALSLLRAVSSPSLNEISIVLQRPVPTISSMRALLDAIARFRGTLQCCKIDMTRLFPSLSLTDLESRHDPIPIKSLLQPLSALGKSLRALELPNTPLQICASDLVDLLKACPNLEFLQLGQYHRKTAPGLPIGVLADVILLGPNLVFLGLRLDVAGIASVELPDTPATLAHKLWSFSFGYDPEVENCAEAMDFMQRCFPSARLPAGTCRNPTSLA